MSHSKYATLKVILEENFPFNYTYYTVAHKCRIARLGRRACLFNVWKMRKETGHRKPRWSAGPQLRILCPWSRPPTGKTHPAYKKWMKVPGDFQYAASRRLLRLTLLANASEVAHAVIL